VEDENEMTKDPLRTKLCDMLGIEYPILAFTHCKDIGVARLSPMSETLDDMLAKIPETPGEVARQIKEKYDVPHPKGPNALHQWGGLNQEMARRQLDVSEQLTGEPE
jgi:hypothetical protein